MKEPVENLLSFVLQAENIEYGLFNANGQLVEQSPGLMALHDTLADGYFLTDVFPELIGYEQVLEDIRSSKCEPLLIDRFHNVHLWKGQGYMSLHVLACQGGLLVIVRDVTAEANLEQRVVQKRNELALLTAELVDELQEANEGLKEAYQSTLEGWAKALELRDFETKGHSDRVTELSVRLGRNLGLNDIDLENLRRGALIHDIGKMGIPDDILLKPGPLNETEWEIMKLHPAYAYEMLRSVKFLKDAVTVACYHHERWDGSGYPQQLSGEQIPLLARIFSVVDVWDALLSDRPYREAWPRQEVEDYLRDNRGLRFDPKIVDVFLRIVGQE